MPAKSKDQLGEKTRRINERRRSAAEWTDNQTDRRTDAAVYEWTDKQTDRGMDTAVYESGLRLRLQLQSLVWGRKSRWDSAAKDYNDL